MQTHQYTACCSCKKVSITHTRNLLSSSARLILGLLNEVMKPITNDLSLSTLKRPLGL
jgi:hypothetical protein